MDQITPVAPEIRKTQLIDLTRLNQLLEMKDLHRDAYAHLKRLQTACKGCSTNTASLDVVYTLARGFEGKPFGRLYEVKQLGMQCLWREIRAFLADPHYWDVDVVNCHYAILLQLADGLGVEPFRTQHIRKYVENRDEMLYDISPSREVGKLALIKVLYGGKVDDMDTDEDDAEHVDAAALEAIRDEVHDLTALFWTRQKELRSIEKIRRADRAQTSFLSYYLHSLERKVVLAASDYLDSIGRRMDCIIHDGGLVRKLEGEKEPPQQLLDDIRAYVKKRTGFDLAWTFKPLKHSFTVSADIPENETYQAVKAEFEKHKFAYSGHVYRLGRVFTESVTLRRRRYNDLMLSFTQAGHEYGNIYYKELVKGVIVSQPFFEKWKKDPKRREYEHLEFTPKQDPKDTKIYNLFESFDIEDQMKENPEILETCPDFETTLVYSWLREVICDDNEKRFMYLMKICHKILFRPYIQTGVMPIFFSDAKGTGKSLFCLWMSRMIGMHMTASTSKPELIFGHFTDLLCQKAMVVYEEGDVPRDLTDTMKEFITTEVITIHPKGMPPRPQMNNTQFFQCTNHMKAISAEGGCRRLVVYPVSDRYVKVSGYYSALYKALNDVKTQAAFYVYLQKHHDIEYNMEWFQENRPLDETLNTAQLSGESQLVKFFYHLVEHCDGNEGGQKYRFHREFQYAKDIHEIFMFEMHKTDKNMTPTTLGKQLSQTVKFKSFVQSVKAKDRMMYKIDYEGMKDFLKRSGYIE